MPDDYSANVQTTGAVAVGGSATGSIETAHDQDWFAVDLVAGRTYQFDLGGSPSGGGTLSDTFLRAIYDSEGRYQSDSYNDDFGGSRDSRVTFTASQSGTYYVRASGDRDETGSYTLRVSDVTPGSVETRHRSSRLRKRWHRRSRRRRVRRPRISGTSRSWRRRGSRWARWTAAPMGWRGTGSR